MGATESTYTLVPNVDLADMFVRHGRLLGVGIVQDAEELPFQLHEESPQLPGGRLTVVEFEDGAYWILAGPPGGPLYCFGALPDHRRGEGFGGANG
jgi:hypothetical protein